MGWQDRDYARRDVYHGHVGHPARPPILRGRSIVTILIIVNVAIYVLGADWWGKFRRIFVWEAPTD